ncbi:FAD-binding monooxygenase moxY [Fulvia fulva]|uniref:FAD-binding monooxygenase moxY n=1 Tax=Passalora fulva TaxID=5499 RepID=A0A9Q8P478_PASFU|nr:FAD-binding monooxygenase moxY [Fulvia fulva]KAK4635895.1 FAD-binding monooxygenase moxY [Fulvia fulva]KAK4637509.1 FAD-binding monooxygenase moxY [Fulvia fulva]UJO12526.1 FAD-binding monooxygenase moxY [Fulvia fulva]WPV09018.1 FAD-binding monooxygenase moxY [Fulvia fulva]WPV25329.1 FAD-binding monooxygenase moxY [Fulvia fulva]
MTIDADMHPTGNDAFRNAHVVDTEDVQISDHPMGTQRPMKVIFMGMGASGINFSYQLARRTTGIDLVVYEKNAAVGGTWHENVYDGCACDIPSVCYQFTWHRKPNWSSYYSGSSEICKYMTDVATEHDLLRFVKLRHQITKAEWQEDIGKWRVTVRGPDGTFDDFADFFINGGGCLNNWRWPEIEGLHDFKGKLMHTARYDKTHDLTDKRVLTVGIGSSGVQVIPKILHRVKELHVVARSPVWITNGFAQTWAAVDGGNFDYTEEAKKRFRQDDKQYQAYCKAIESELNVRFRLILNGTPEASAAKEFSINEMSRKSNHDPELIDKLMPKNFNVGCRRPTPGNGFLEALTDDKTQVYFGEIPKITPSGFLDRDGKEHEVDTIICATGFDTSFMPPFEVLYHGKNLQDNFRGDIKGYLGLAYPEVPNYFIFLGAYGPLRHGSVLPMVEHYTDHVLQVIEKARVENIKRLSVKKAVSEDFTKYADEFLKRTAWAGPCSSWFRNGKISNKPVLWPGSRIHQLTVLQHPRFEHFDIEYRDGNSCSFLGNGFDVRETDGRDLTWYMGFLDGEDKQPGPFEMGIEDGSGRICGEKNIRA